METTGLAIGLSTVAARAEAPPPAGLVPPGALIDRAERAGAGFLLLDATLPPAYAAELAPLLHARRGSLPALVVENVFPADRVAAAELAALDRSEARAAAEAGIATIRRAADHGAGFVLVRLGEVTGARARWPIVRRAFLRGALDDDRGPAERLLRDRAAHAPPHLDAARRSLDALAEAAARHGIRLCLRNPARAIGLPSPIELRLLLDDLGGAPIAPALDAAAAHLADAMGLVPFEDTLAAWKGAEIALLADACGPVAGLPPGRGELDLAKVSAALGKDARIAFTPSAGLTEEELLEGMEATRRLPRAR